MPVGRPRAQSQEVRAVSSAGAEGGPGGVGGWARGWG